MEKQKLVQEYPRHKLINFNYEEITREEETFQRCEQVQVSKYANRAEIISAIIRNRYAAADEIAKINNVLADPDDLAAQADYADYQERRVLAKAVADCVGGIDNLVDVKQTIRDLKLEADFDLRKAAATLKAELKQYMKMED
jgi:ABC-type transporter Mla subunit MlaD